MSEAKELLVLYNIPKQEQKAIEELILSDKSKSWYEYKIVKSDNTPFTLNWHITKIIKAINERLAHSIEFNIPIDDSSYNIIEECNLKCLISIYGKDIIIAEVVAFKRRPKQIDNIMLVKITRRKIL